jgi:hypothetical protein
MNIKQKRVFLGHLLDKAFGLGADGNDEAAKSLVRRVMRVLNRMTEEERGPILDVHFRMLSKRLVAP